MYNIEEFKTINSLEKYVVTQHSRKRFEERNILITDINEAIDSGEIIKQYTDDKPFPSCLILGKSKGKVLHIVASINEGLMYIITAYVPSPSKWENDWKTRREE